METMKCPYCDITVRLADVEADDGACPECGAPLMGSMLFDHPGSASDDYDDSDEAGASPSDDSDDDDL